MECLVLFVYMMLIIVFMNIIRIIVYDVQYIGDDNDDYSAYENYVYSANENDDYNVNANDDYSTNVVISALPFIMSLSLLSLCHHLYITITIIIITVNASIIIHNRDNKNRKQPSSSFSWSCACLNFHQNNFLCICMMDLCESKQAVKSSRSTDFFFLCAYDIMIREHIM